MKIAKRIMSFVLSLAMVLTLVSVAPAVTAEAAAKASVSITVPTTKSTYTFNRTAKTTSFTIKYKVTGGKKKSVTFKSSDTKVATVNKSGKVTTRKAGTATITVSVKLKSGKTVKDTLKLTVKQKVTKLAATVKNTVSSKGVYLVPVGKTRSLKLTFTPSKPSSKKVTYKSDNTKVAKVSSKGVITGVKAGKATITVTAADGSKKSAKVKVQVVKPATKVVINKGAASVKMKTGKTATLTTAFTPSAASAWGVTYKSSNTSVATVNKTTGKVTAKKAGTATITATANDGVGKKDTIKIVVSDPISSITLNKTSVSIKKGATETITYTVKPSTASDDGVTYSSDNEKVATVKNGVITAVAGGTATITVTSKENSKKTATVKVTVIDPISSIKITSATKVALATNGTSQIKYSVVPTTADNGVTYTSSDKSVATVDATGKITAVGRGTAQIIVTSKENTKVTTAVTVTVTEATYTAVKINSGAKASLTVTTGDTASLVSDLDSAATTCKAELESLSGSDWSLTVDGKSYTVSYKNGVFDYTDDATGKSVKADLAKASGKQATVVVPATSKVDEVLSALENIQKKSLLGDTKSYNYTVSISGASKAYELKNLKVAKQYTTFVSGTTTYSVYVENKTLYVKGDVTTGTNIFTSMKADGLVTLTKN